MKHLRPLERRVLAMHDDGLKTEEIGRRIRKSPERVESIIAWTAIPRIRPPARRSPTAIERRVTALLDSGETHAQVGKRFNRSAAYVRQVEGLAHYRQAIDLLGARRQNVEGQA